MDLNHVNILSTAKITPKSQWIYCAGFNIKTDLTSTERVEEEIQDLKLLNNLYQNLY